MIFLENFYKTQTLSCEKLKRSGFVDPKPGATVFTELPALINYYLSRWEHLNLFSSFSSARFAAEQNAVKPQGPAEQLAETFSKFPRELLEATHRDGITPLKDIL
jgi:hypothetical protein